MNELYSDDNQFNRCFIDSDSDDDHHHKHHKNKHHDKHYYDHHVDAHEAVSRHHEKEVAMVHKAIEDDFAHKLMDFKQSQTGHEFRLFGHTMVNYH